MNTASGVGFPHGDVVGLCASIDVFGFTSATSSCIAGFWQFAMTDLNCLAMFWGVPLEGGYYTSVSTIHVLPFEGLRCLNFSLQTVCSLVARHVFASCRWAAVPGDTRTSLNSKDNPNHVNCDVYNV